MQGGLLNKPVSYTHLDVYKRQSLKHTIEFMQWKYKIDDIDIRKVNHNFITEYDFYLRSVRKCANNSAVKYLKNFGKIVRICLSNGWLATDPFLNYKNKVCLLYTSRCV